MVKFLGVLGKALQIVHHWSTMDVFKTEIYTIHQHILTYASMHQLIRDMPNIDEDTTTNHTLQNTC